MTPDEVYYVLVVLGAVTAAYAMWRMVRRTVHIFDAVETAANNLTVAVDIIIQQFSSNGGRLTQPLTEESVRKANVMDLLLDLRSLLGSLQRTTTAHDRAADIRANNLIEAFKKSHK